MLKPLLSFLSASHSEVVGVSDDHQPIVPEHPTLKAVVSEQPIRIDLSESVDADTEAAIVALAESFILTPQPDWTNFRIALYGNLAWKRVLNSNPATGSAIATTLWQVAANPSLLTEVKLLWDGLIGSLDTPLTNQDIDELNAIASSNHIPLKLGEDGLMESL